jgi:hypothetical protein
MSNEPPVISSKSSSLGISLALENDQPKKLRRSTTFPSESFKEPSEHDTCLGWTGFIVSLYFNKVAVYMFGGITGWKWYNRYEKHLVFVFEKCRAYLTLQAIQNRRVGHIRRLTDANTNQRNATATKFENCHQPLCRIPWIPWNVQ